jgi:hypothetical protein
VPLEEPLCRVEINRSENGDGYVATIYSDYDGTRELRGRNLETLLRELTIDLEFSFGESTRRGAGMVEETPPSFEEEGVYPGEEML